MEHISRLKAEYEHCLASLRQEQEQLRQLILETQAMKKQYETHLKQLIQDMSKK